MKLIEINNAIFDHRRFHPKVVLTDAANGFALALETMGELLWLEVNKQELTEVRVAPLRLFKSAN